ncbi:MULTISPECIES: hypothetical protein [Streptomyces]|uniref:Uncharacterized protein n=1 Tax=Streptomyces lonegramiae TaxID=3075524 RepID=A0ABU2XDU0_9ACTN|nr:hypothetical protein [Streptomyces sp. DSM 41529]MDT0543587.1 hypothetical protein [Streptomyces sp. DSM 41529]
MKDKREGHAAAAEAPPELTVYQAEAAHRRFALDLYTNREAARAHCEAYARREPCHQQLDWYPDPDNEAVERLFVAADKVSYTGFTVTAVTVASEYGGEADE